MRADRRALARGLERVLRSAASTLSAVAQVAGGAMVSPVSVVSPATVAAAEIDVYSAGAVEPGLLALSPAWTRETGHVARLTVGVPAVLRQRIASRVRPPWRSSPPRAWSRPHA